MDWSIFDSTSGNLVCHTKDLDEYEEWSGEIEKGEWGEVVIVVNDDAGKLVPDECWSYPEG